MASHLAILKMNFICILTLILICPFAVASNDEVNMGFVNFEYVLLKTDQAKEYRGYAIWKELHENIPPDGWTSEEDYRQYMTLRNEILTFMLEKLDGIEGVSRKELLSRAVNDVGKETGFNAIINTEAVLYSDKEGSKFLQSLFVNLNTEVAHKLSNYLKKYSTH